MGFLTDDGLTKAEQLYILVALLRTVKAERVFYQVQTQLT
jgi:hypothetical protein